MARARGNMGLTALIVVVVLLLHQTCSTSAQPDHHCPPSSCGSIHNISYPFRLTSDPEKCGDPRFILSCENNQTVVLQLYGGRYYVREIDYDSESVRVVDPGVVKDNHPFIPRYLLDTTNFSSGDSGDYYSYATKIVFVNCEKPVNSRYHFNISACVKDDGMYSPKRYRYALFQYSGIHNAVNLGELCQVDQISFISYELWYLWWYGTDKRSLSCKDFYNESLWNFELSWNPYRKGIGLKDLLRFIGKIMGFIIAAPGSYIKNGILYNLLYSIGAPLPISVLTYTVFDYGLFQAAKLILGTPFVIAFLIYKWRRRHLSKYNIVEEFLESHNNLMPIRYSYSEIKKITKSFKDKLGEGGYGTVFKGTLRSGRLVAIKMLGKSKANGEDFISEVATIGRIHHVNVVQLIGFCVEGSKRALVYEFMPNGSLNKYIFFPEVGTLLSYNQMYDIALGVARGIEYLHQGCDMQILHFDIKPHNILLDENFTPKISDFGLAKLYSVNDSIVSLTAARGTLGYMAPELFYKNIGGISYKADVYSFGMLLMEMANRRKNLNAFAEHTSQIYFPTWVYDQLHDGNDVEIEDATEEEKKIGKKMIIVALWCIQMKPSDRPSMNKVIKMLQGEVECLQMPSKPFLSSLKSTITNGGENSNESSQSSQF